MRIRSLAVADAIGLTASLFVGQGIQGNMYKTPCRLISGFCDDLRLGRHHQCGSPLA